MMMMMKERDELIEYDEGLLELMEDLVIEVEYE